MTRLVIALPGGSLELLEGRVLRNGQSVKIEPRAWRVLEQLARFRHRVVTKEELLAALRPEGVASPDALRQAIRAARRAIGDDLRRPVIRSIPRVGYILDVPPAAPVMPAAAGTPAEPTPSLFIGPVHNESGLPGLHWVEAGLGACIAHGLALDGRIQLRDGASLDGALTQGRGQVRKMLRATGARHAVTGALTLQGQALVLCLWICTDESESSLSIRASTVAGLVVPALQAVRERVLGERELPAGLKGLKNSSALSIELFARAKQWAAEHRHAAALRALELLHSIEPGFPRLELELLRAQAICGSDAGEATAARLLRPLQRDQDPALEAQVRQYLGTLHHVRGQLREAALSLQQALYLGRACMPAPWQGHTLTLLASVECRLGEMHSVQAHLDEAQATFMRIGSQHGLLGVLWLRAVMSSLSGHAEQAIRWNKKLAAGARRLRAGTTLVNACLNLAGELIYADRLEEARRFAEEASATAMAIESGADLLGLVANVHCLLHRLQGRPDAAAELLAQWPRPADVPDEGYLWQAHGHAAMAAGRTAHAAQCFQRAAAEMRARGNRVGEGPLLPWFVEALVRCGRQGAAQDELARAATQPHLQDEPTTANLLYARAVLARSRGQPAQALDLLAQLANAPAALPLYRRLGRELACTPGDATDASARPALPPNGSMRRQYRFAHCMLDTERREFWVDGRLRPLAPKPFEVLLHLYRNRHRVVAQDELLDVLWHESGGSPELVTQAIAKIRQAVRTSSAAARLVRTVYGKGYRLLADPHAEADDDAAAMLLSDLPATQEPWLAVVPLAAPDPGAEYPLKLFGCSLALHARLRRLPAAELREATAGVDAAAREALVAAIRRRWPGAWVVFAALMPRGPLTRLEYVVDAPGARAEGRLRGSSPTALGQRLAARMLRLDGPAPQSAPDVGQDAWLTELLRLAALAVDHRRWNAATRILDVIRDADPDHASAAELRARVAAGAGQDPAASLPGGPALAGRLSAA